jgi:hypothetical protein
MTKDDDIMNEWSSVVDENGRAFDYSLRINEIVDNE